ncbi:acyltransferase family protein [Cryptosporangium sp. NPDC051539]|uniref:acyltransferase family protein n=1 Tax=Cryptosporangium sp. NPDC051539 TaxID=3363962 RepID=UPI0037A3FA93
MAPSASVPHPEPSPKLGYRPALDGLRAVAVLAVLVYHLGASWLPGGFLGVDLFFVLSGFLITTLLLEEWSARGRIDLGTFWLRRARRLLPPALLVVAAVMVVGWRTVDPSQLGRLRADGLWTLFYGANWHLIGSGQSYFDAFAAPSPLRHAWSLAIEEQFYLVWPLVLLVVVWKARRFLLPVIGLVIAVSAVLMAVRYTAEDPSRAYYGTDTRVFELLIGAAAAVLRPRVGRVVTGMAAAGVLGGLLFVHDEWAGFYRGGAVAFAMVAAVLVVGTLAHPARVLTAGPVVGLGLISYGVYLWHWPVYCWLDDAWLPTTTSGTLAHGTAKIALTLALSLASYWLVEKPVRRGAFGLTGRRIIFAAPTAIAAVAALTLVATAAATAPAQVEERDVTALSTPRTMVAATPATQLRLATVGDSVVKSLAPGLARAADERGWSYTDASVSSCSVAGLLMLEEDGSPWSTGTVCPQVVTTVQQRLIDEERPDVILVHSRWETYRVRGADGDPVDVGTPAHEQFVANQLRRTMERLTSGGARVVWIDSTPMTESLCRRLGHPTATCEHTAADPTVDAYSALRRHVAAQFHGRVTSLSLTDLLCSDERCPDTVDGRTLRPDGLHFSEESAETIVPELLERVARALVLP